MSKSLSFQLDKILARVKTVIEKDARQPAVMKGIGEFAVNLIVKRTRLGYGVDRPMGSKAKLRSLSPNYIKARKASARLSGTTSARKSNLTFSGEMLESVKVIKISRGVISIAPTGVHKGGEKNAAIALYNARRGRTFLNISELEFRQLLRFYRKTFGDLVKKRRLLR